MLKPVDVNTEVELIEPFRISAFDDVKYSGAYEIKFAVELDKMSKFDVPVAIASSMMKGLLEIVEPFDIAGMSN